ncbi:MAG: DEAD/DEAH box helicase family protein [Bacteroidetes bacterium]|nr:DEAD/DEAH box helicase family protein [Bacteroidota bacterium]
MIRSNTSSTDQDLVRFLPTSIDFDQDNIQEIVASRYEFTQYPIPETEPTPSAGRLFSQQVLGSRLISANKHGMLFYHAPGTGKTILAISYLERILADYTKNQEIFVIVSGDKQKNIIRENLMKYNPQAYDIASTNKAASNQFKIRFIRSRNAINAKYHILTKKQFVKQIVDLTDNQIKSQYGHCNIWFDEIQNIIPIVDINKFYNGKPCDYTKILRFVNVSNAKVLMTSFTPVMTDIKLMNLFIQLLRPNTPINKTYDMSVDRRNLMSGCISSVPTLKINIKINKHGKTYTYKGVDTVLYDIEMSDYQGKLYEKIMKEPVKQNENAAYNSSISVALGCFPDGDIKNEGEVWYTYDKKNIEKSTLSESFIDILNRESSKYKLLMIRNYLDKYRKQPNQRQINTFDFKAKIRAISKYSAVYAKIMSIIYDTELVNGGSGGCNTLSCERKKPSGIAYLCALLNYVGFEPYTGGIFPNTKARRFSVISGDPSTETQSYAKIKFQNSPENFKGEYLSFFIVSKVGSSGISFYNVKNQFIFNTFVLATDIQAEARALRVNAYEVTINDMRSKGIVDPRPELNRYLLNPIYSPKSGYYSIQEKVIQLAIDKDLPVVNLNKRIREESVDLLLMKNRMDMIEVPKYEAKTINKEDYHTSDYFDSDVDAKINDIIRKLRKADSIYYTDIREIDDITLTAMIDKIKRSRYWGRDRYGFKGYISYSHPRFTMLRTHNDITANFPKFDILSNTPVTVIRRVSVDTSKSYEQQKNLFDSSSANDKISIIESAISNNRDLVKSIVDEQWYVGSKYYTITYDKPTFEIELIRRYSALIYLIPKTKQSYTNLKLKNYKTKIYKDRLQSEIDLSDFEQKWKNWIKNNEINDQYTIIHTIRVLPNIENISQFYKLASGGANKLPPIRILDDQSMRWHDMDINTVNIVRYIVMMQNNDRTATYGEEPYLIRYNDQDWKKYSNPKMWLMKEKYFDLKDHPTRGAALTTSDNLTRLMLLFYIRVVAQQEDEMHFNYLEPGRRIKPGLADLSKLTGKHADKCDKIPLEYVEFMSENQYLSSKKMDELSRLIVKEYSEQDRLINLG